VNVAAAPGAKADYTELQSFARKIDPSIDRLQSYDSAYFSNKLRKAKYNVDAEQVRQYFTLDKTQAGIFKLVHDLFKADIRPWHTPVWDPSVSAWELYEGDTLVGRFYLDLSPRDGKYNHAAQFPIRTGVAGRQVPVGALVTNFPATGPMDHGDVTTFLHEFGHLIHNLYSGRTQYAAQSMGNLQWDFIEAPSQLLEEWTWNYATLKEFASNAKGQAIPQDLVKRMNQGRHFGEAIMWKGQLANSAVSLNFYNRKPDFDLSATYNEQMQRYSLFPAVPGTHRYDAFGHLNGYSAIYYTYVWSKAIALDLFTQFQAKGLRNADTALRYRQLVLDPGGSQDANELISNFLGRPLSLDAFKAYLQ
jgi:thimet oligopeptidase